MGYELPSCGRDIKPDPLGSTNIVWKPTILSLSLITKADSALKLSIVCGSKSRDEAAHVAGLAILVNQEWLRGEVEKADRSAVSTRLASFVPSNGRSHNSTRDFESRIERSVESKTWLQSFLLAWRDAYTRPTDLVRRMSRIDQIHGNDKSIESFPFERSRNRSRRSNICTNRLSSLRKRIFCSCKRTIAREWLAKLWRSQIVLRM